MSTRKFTAPLSDREKIAALNFAIDRIVWSHSEAHRVDISDCKCEFGVAVKHLKLMRREVYVAIEARKAKEARRAN